MNWSKAKTILITALLITDIFLILTYGNFGKAEAEEFSDNQTLSAFLAQNNIYVDAEIIPKTHEDMAALYVAHEEISPDLVRELILSGQNRFTVLQNNDDEYKRAADLFLEELSGAGFESILKNAAYDEITKSGEYTKVIYKNIADHLTVEKSYIICYFENGRLADADFEWLSITNFHNRKQATISAAQALLLFMSRVQSANQEEIYISGIEMIYWADESSIDIEAAVSADTALPVWKIVYNDGEAVYIDAYEH